MNPAISHTHERRTLPYLMTYTLSSIIILLSIDAIAIVSVPTFSPHGIRSSTRSIISTSSLISLSPYPTHPPTNCQLTAVPQKNDDRNDDNIIFENPSTQDDGTNTNINTNTNTETNRKKEKLLRVIEPTT